MAPNIDCHGGPSLRTTGPPRPGAAALPGERRGLDARPDKIPEALALLSFNQCERAIQQWLSKAYARPLARLTGFNLHLMWPAPLSAAAGPERPMLCPFRASVLASGSLPSGTCQTCVQQHWIQAELPPAGKVERFVGRCGIACLRVRSRSDGIGTLTLVAAARTVDGCARAGCQPHKLPNRGHRTVVRGQTTRHSLARTASLGRREALGAAEAMLQMALEGVSAMIRAE